MKNKTANIKSYQKKYYQEHREELLKNQKEYHQRPEVKKKRKIYLKKYYLKNKERIKEKDRKYYLKNKEKIKQRVKKWTEKNPGKKAMTSKNGLEKFRKEKKERFNELCRNNMRKRNNTQPENYIIKEK